MGSTTSREDDAGPSELGSCNVEATGNSVGRDMNIASMHNNFTYVTNVQNGEVTELDDPLIYGFPSRLGHEDCLGREADIEELLELLETYQYVLVTGCGGIGKTTLAIKCAEMWTTTGDFQKAAFLLMEDEKAVKSSFKCNLHLDNNFLPDLQSYDKLNKSKILLIFDNINDGMAIQPYLPDKIHHPNIYVLGTSQDNIPQLFHGYKLKDLPESVAVELVKNILDSPTGIPDDLLRRLVQSLDCWALAVRQAASVICQYIEETGKDIVTAIETYTKERDVKLNEKLGQEYSKYDESTVFESVRYNIHKCINDDVIAKKLLHIFSYLNPTYIDKDMFQHVPGVTEDILNKIIYRFVKYSIVAEEGPYLTMHGTTRIVIRHAYADAENAILPCLFHIIHTCDHGYVRSLLTYVLSEMSKTMLTRCYQTLFTSDHYKRQREELEEYDEGIVLEWEAPQFAAYLGHAHVLDRLRQLNSPDSWVTKSGWSWIHAAVLGSQRYVLSEYMTDSSIKDKKNSIIGHTALYLDTKKERDLIRRGKNLNIRNLYGDSALYIALSRGDLDSARELLESGSEINSDFCSEIMANYSVIKKLKFPSSITGEEHLFEADIQYLFITTVVQVEEMRPGTLFRFHKYVDSPHNTQMLKEIQDETGEEFGDVLETVDRIFEFAVLAFKCMRQHQLTVRQLVEEIYGEEQIHGFKVLYPLRSCCFGALAFTKLLLIKIKNSSPDAFSILALLTALPHYHTTDHVSDYLELNTGRIVAAIKRLEGYGILSKRCLKNEIRALTRAFMTLEELPSDTCLVLFTAVLCALERFEENIARLVLDQVSLKQITVACERASRLDPRRRWVKLLEKLQKAECKSIESPTDVTWSALHYAIVFLHMDSSNFPKHVIKKLLRLGAEVNVRGPGDVTPLHVAALCYLSFKKVRILIKNAAQVSAVTIEGFTPLHMAISSGSMYTPKTVAALLEAGGQVNAVTHDGLTPLHMVASSDPKYADETIAVLLEAGGQVNVVTPEGLTPLHMAASVRSLDTHGTIAALLRAGGQVNSMTHEGLTPLHMAASRIDYYSYNTEQIIHELLMAGADPQIQDKKGRTPLDVAHPDLRDILMFSHKTIHLNKYKQKNILGDFVR